MRKQIFLSLVFLAIFVFFGCKTAMKAEPTAGSEYSALLKDGNGDPIPCASDQDCENLVERDNCIYGAVCHQGNCAALIFDTCCLSDGKGNVTCPSFMGCAVDDDCDDVNICTADKCNTYLFDGICTHAPVYMGEENCGEGECQRSVPACLEGQPNGGNCVPGDPVAETCNGLDDDCDTVVDNGFPDKGLACDGADSDLCLNGTYTCTIDGLGVECVNENPQNIVEICNSLDDDCDSVVDNGFPDKGLPCDGADSDLCQFGTYTCTIDGLGVECVNEDPAGIIESCNGLDDDCVNGIDDGNPGGGEPCDTGLFGVCAAGITACEAGQIVCNQDTQSSPETCNSLDDDCDSVVDNGFPDKGLPCDGADSDLCLNGAYTCTIDGLGVECVNENPQNIVEACNGLDDDCDSVVDNGFPDKGLACDGADSDLCQFGTYTCTIDGLGVECINEDPQNIVEVCDGLDNDCNTFVDDGLGETGCGLGECEHIVQNCVAGVPQTCDPMEGSEDESCDGLDNDCDGASDEGFACSTCNNPLGALACGQNFVGAATNGDNWLNGYSCKPTWNEFGSEAVFTFETVMGGVQITAKPINIVPVGADLDTFVLSDTCEVASCVAAGNFSATFLPVIETVYHVVVDGYNGASGTFDLQVTCKEKNCDDLLDNDVDGLTDCDDATDCSTAPACQGAKEICTGGIDEDGDTFVDCADSDCNFDDACVGSCATGDSIICGGIESGTTVGSINVISGYNCAAFDESGPEKAYSFIAPYTGSATAILSGLSADLDIFILSPDCQANDCLAFGNNAASFSIIQNQTYYLVVDGFAGNSGSYTLTLSCSAQ